MIRRASRFTFLLLLAACSSNRTEAIPVPSSAEPSAARADLEKMMRDFENRKRYDHLDEATLRDVADADLVTAIRDYISTRIAGSGKEERAVVANLSKGFQAIHATSLLDAEVQNGGYNQFFWNSSGEFAQMAAEGFELIGAAQHAELTRKAIAQYASEEPDRRKFKARGDLDAFSESYKHTKLGELDPLYFTLEKRGEDLGALQVRFIRANPKLFVAP